MKNLRWSVLICLTTLASLTTWALARNQVVVNQAQNAPARQAAQPGHAAGHEDEFSIPAGAVAVLVPTEGNTVRGVIRFEQNRNGVRVTGVVAGLEPGLHGFHIHEFGDRRDPNGVSAGGHYNPSGHKHGGPQDTEKHAGDLGNIEANAEGEANVSVAAPWLNLHHILGRSVVVHAGPDDLKSQPAGDAGGRVAVGIIGIAQPPQPEPAAGQTK
jgi:Cu-Zn family superoxide dismutase